jgi:hypothetical protein
MQRGMSLAVMALNLLGALALHFYLSVIDLLPTGQQPLRTLEGIGMVAFAVYGGHLCRRTRLVAQARKAGRHLVRTAARWHTGGGGAGRCPS